MMSEREEVKINRALNLLTVLRLITFSLWKNTQAHSQRIHVYTCYIYIYKQLSNILLHTQMATTLKTNT